MRRGRRTLGESLQGECKNLEGNGEEGQSDFRKRTGVMSRGDEGSQAGKWSGLGKTMGKTG